LDFETPVPAGQQKDAPRIETGLTSVLAPAPTCVEERVTSKMPKSTLVPNS
jgi:hypothetical protein